MKEYEVILKGDDSLIIEADSVLLDSAQGAYFFLNFDEESRKRTVAFVERTNVICIQEIFQSEEGEV